MSGHWRHPHGNRSHERRCIRFSKKKPLQPAQLINQLQTCSRKKDTWYLAKRKTQRKTLLHKQSRSTLIIGESSAHQKYSPNINQSLAQTNVDTIIYGETGCGKDCGCTRFASI